MTERERQIADGIMNLVMALKDTSDDGGYSEQDLDRHADTINALIDAYEIMNRK